MQASLWLLRPYNIVNKLCKKAFLQKVNPTDTIFFLLPYLRSGKVASSKILGGQIVYEIIGLPGTTEGISKKRGYESKISCFALY